MCVCVAGRAKNRKLLKQQNAQISGSWIKWPICLFIVLFTLSALPLQHFRSWGKRKKKNDKSHKASNSDYLISIKKRGNLDRFIHLRRVKLIGPPLLGNNKYLLNWNLSCHIRCGHTSIYVHTYVHQTRYQIYMRLPAYLSIYLYGI